MIKKFDIFPKAAENELKVRTNMGGFLTITSLVFLLWLTVTEILKFVNIRETDQMILNNQPLPSNLPISIDLFVYNNCTDLHFEVTNIKRTMIVDTKILSQKFIPKDDGCNILIDAIAPNVPASFHIGIGKSYFTEDGNHHHLWYVVQNRNLSHKINRIKFGDLRSIKSTMDGIELITPNPVAYMHTYSIQLVPVSQNNNETGYMAIASLMKTNLDKIRTRGIAAIIFEWNFSPIGFRRSKAHEPIINLISHLCAICGCFFVFVRFLDSFSFCLSGL